MEFDSLLAIEALETALVSVGLCVEPARFFCMLDAPSEEPDAIIAALGMCQAWDQRNLLGSSLHV